MKIKIILISIFYFNFISPSYAYLDPGTGAIILQAILGGIAAAFTYIIFYFKKVKSFLREIFKKKSKK
jgi:hypothetical protein